MSYRKKTCGNCSLDGACDCQQTQEKCNVCGMEQVIGYNRAINTRGQNYDNPEYAAFMADKQTQR